MWHRLKNRLPNFPNRRTRFFAYLYLVNLLIPFCFLWMLPVQLALFGVGLLLVFAGSYVFSYIASRRQKLICICLEVALLMVMIAVLNLGYVWLIFYPTATVGVVFNRTSTVLRWIGGIWALLISEVLALSTVQPLAVSDWAMILSAAASSTAAALGTMWQMETMRSHLELRKANAQIERLTKAAERDRISQDLHDVMGHELSMITLKAQLVQRLVDSQPERARAEARDIEAAARRALTRVREYIADIRQPRLEEEWEDAVKLLTAAGMECSVEVVESAWHLLPPQVSQALAMCLREATTNVVRHSGAKRVLLRAWKDGQSVHLLVADDGTGLRSQEGLGVGQGTGNGLLGIRARMSAVDGVVSLWSNGSTSASPDLPPAVQVPWRRGTAVYLCVPLSGPAAETRERA
jgi:two-component system sensor histidine kinase DesK